MEKQSFASAMNDNGTANKNLKNRSAASMASIDGLDDDGDKLDLLLGDVRSALENLGYKEKEITPIIHEIKRSPDADTQPEFQGLLKSALKSLRSSLA